jgi:DNA-binding CsgD family transcriptional regulator
MAPFKWDYRLLLEDTSEAPCGRVVELGQSDDGWCRRMMFSPDFAGDLVGRKTELNVMRSFVAAASSGSSALVLSGEPGSGKTVLLDVAAATASAVGIRVLRAVGSEFETNLSFAGLNQIIMPLLSFTDELEPAYQDALQVVLGFGNGCKPERLVICNAVMALLRHAALVTPLLVIVDDAQWFDDASIGVLAFAGRRGVNRVGFLVAIRSGENSSIERSGVPVHVLSPLSDDAAAILLEKSFPTSAPRVRERLIAEAAGSPLALMELPAALSAAQLEAVEALPCTLPLTRRLHAMFEGRIMSLPEQTQRVLLLAALDGVGDLQVLQSVTEPSQILDDLAPAERVCLVVVDSRAQRVTFRNPLIRSCVVQSSTGSERRQAHRALAGATLEQPDRHAWHLAEASIGADGPVAALLDQVAQRMLDKGDLIGAASTSTRAASLSASSADRARRLAFAAYYSAKSGEYRTGSRLLEVARQADPMFAGSLSNAVAAAFLLIAVDGDILLAHQLLTEALRTHPGPWNFEDKLVAEALHTLELACSLGRDPELWKAYKDALARLTPHAPVELLLKHTVLADPARATAPWLARLEQAVGELHNETDPTKVVRICGSARYVDRTHLCRAPLRRIVEDSGGASSIKASALRDLALDNFLSGRWDESERLASEGIKRTEHEQYRYRTFEFQHIRALLTAARGDDDANRAACDEMTSWAEPRQCRAIQYASLHARALAAIGRGEFEQAYRFASAVSPPGKLASYIGEALMVFMDLVEAAVHTNRLNEAKAHVTTIREIGVAALSPRLAMLSGGATALTHSGDVATELFEQALAVPDADRWPFDRARVQLAYGEHLRRRHAASCSRVQLTEALTTFEKLGARPWAARTGNELRATGQVRQSNLHTKPAALTPQEQAIAALAASGLSNKQIAERLYLSHRTVENHLHRVFPKLGVTSRAALRDALSTERN